MNRNRPTEHAIRWHASYDISSDFVRAKVARLLSRYGARALYSCFHLPAWDSVTIDQLMEQVCALLHPGDLFIIARECPNCSVATAGSGLEVGFEKAIVR